MEVILLERVPKLGQMGDVVSVKSGYARNFLLPQGKALRSSPANLADFESRRSDLEARNLELKSEAEKVSAKIIDREFVLIRSASDIGSLYGSVTTRDIAEAASVEGVSVGRQQIELERPIKTLGMHDVSVTLHPEVAARIKVNVARTPEEAEAQARGEEVGGQDDAEDQAEAADAAPAAAAVEAEADASGIEDTGAKPAGS